ncbi:transposase [Cerasicoccus arenae]|nr:transposase [Cerasicoccus arenae]
MFYTLSEARIEDWRWKYNNIRPHRSLGLLTPLEFAAQETQPEPCEINLKGMGYTRATPSFRPSLDTLYQLTINHIINPLRLTYRPVLFA